MAAEKLQTFRTALITDAVGLDLTTTDKLKVVLVTSGHTYNGAADEFLDDISAANRVMTSEAFTGTESAGVLDASDGVVLTDTDNGRVSTQAFLYYDTGTESTSRLLTHDDSVAITSDGTNDTLNFNASGLFSL